MGAISCEKVDLGLLLLNVIILIRARLNGEEGGAGRGGEGRERTKVQPGVLSKPLDALGAGGTPELTSFLVGDTGDRKGLMSLPGH